MGKISFPAKKNIIFKPQLSLRSKNHSRISALGFYAYWHRVLYNDICFIFIAQFFNGVQFWEGCCDPYMYI